MNAPRSIVTLQWIIEGLLLLLLAWLPFAFGGVLPLSHLVLVGGTAAIALLCGLRAVLGGAGFAWSVAFVPLSLFLLLVGFQVLPLAPATVAGFGAENGRLWSELLAEPPLQGGMPAAVTLSLAPAATWTDLRLLVALSLLFVLVIQVYRSRDAVRRLLMGVSMLGALLALLAVLQTLSGTDKLLWIWDSPVGRASSGPFVHYGHFSQFVNLTIGCGIALLLLRLTDRDQRDRYQVEDLVADLRAPDRRFDLFLLGFVVVGIIAISLSRSRNGVISMVVAGVVVAALLHWTRFLRGMGWSLAGLAAVAFVVLLLVGFDPVYDRMATLEDPEDAYSGRLAIAQDALTAAGKFLGLGSGQGSFAAVFPLFDTSERGGRAAHAENQYLELLVETGVVGVGLAVLFVLAIAWPWFRRLRRRRCGQDAVLFGLAFGAVAVAFHATTDFGLRIPSVAALMVVCLGLVVARVGSRVLGGGAGRGLGAVVGFGGALLLAWQLPAIERERVAYGHQEAAEALGKRADRATELDELLQIRQGERNRLAAAIEATPDRVELQVAYALATWRAVVAEEQIDFVDPKVPLEPEQRQRVAARARVIQQALLESRRLSPIHGGLWSLAGQLGTEWLDQPGAADWVRRGFAFAPENPGVVVAAARQLVRDGDAIGAAKLFRRAIRIGANSARILEGTFVELERPDIAREVARGQARWLSWFVARLKREKEPTAAITALIADMRAEAKGLLQAGVESSAPPPWMLAGLASYCAEDGEDEAAVRLYRRYLTLQPDSPQRLQLAQLLHKGGDVEGARQELRRLLNYQPANATAKRLLQQWGMK